MSLLTFSQTNTLLDPRGARVRAAGRLAARPSSLEGGTVLIVDNEKLVGRPNYEPFLPTLTNGLARAAGVASLPVWRRPIMGAPPREMDALVQQIVELRPDAVVVLLGDAGSLRETLTIPARLEGHGIPTVTLVTPQGAGLAATMAQSYCPGLPLVAVQVSHLSAPSQVVQEVEGAIDGLVAAVTSGGKGRVASSLPDVSMLAPVAPDATLDGYLDGASTPDEAADRLYEALDRLRATDGLPIVPPTADRVRRMLAAVDRDPGEVLRAGVAPSGADLTIEKLAVNAVMAGCRPEYFPIVVAAAEAICEDEYFLETGAITTHSSGNCVIVSGPLAGQVGMHAGGGCLGPGFRANATIGRAITLTVINVLRAVPGLSDLATLGSPGEYVYCLAENLEDNPWPGLHQEFYGPDVTSVTVVKAESPHNWLDEYSTTAEQLLEVPIAALSTIANNNAYRTGNVVLFLNPQHAEIVARSGWSRADVRKYVHERARVPVAASIGHGTIPRRPAWTSGLERVPITRSPDDVIVVVAGARGPQSLVAPTWGFSFATSRPVRLAGRSA